MFAHEPLEDEPAEVFFVMAETRKLRIFFPEPDDLRCGWVGDRHSVPTRWVDGAYYKSLVPYIYKKKHLIPAGSFFTVTALQEGRPFTEDPFGPCGDWVELATFDPTGENEFIYFGFWHAVHDDQSRNFERVTNEMEILALATIGLPL